MQLSPTNDPGFIIDKTYKRSMIHDQFGGNRQGGIANCAAFPYIFIFSGEAGHQHGYKDEWLNDEVFSYTGEGQVGHMKFIKGNLALREHLKGGKRVFLFKYYAKGLVTYEAELELIDIDSFNGTDREGNSRSAIKFFFKRVGVSLDFDLSTVKEDQAPDADDTPSKTERQGLITSRVGQGLYRKSILIRWHFKCAVTGYEKKEVLIASHIVPWKESNDIERLDVNNGILLSPTYDALFDQRLISFENTGRIILSDSLLKTNYNSIGVTGKELIKRLSQGNHSYLERHRQNLK